MVDRSLQEILLLRDEILEAEHTLRIGYIRLMRPLVERALLALYEPKEQRFHVELFELTSEAQVHALDIARRAEQLFGHGTHPRAILLTHCHPDHAGSAQSLAERWSWAVYLHAADRPFCESRYRRRGPWTAELAPPSPNLRSSTRRKKLRDICCAAQGIAAYPALGLRRMADLARTSMTEGRSSANQTG